MGIFLPGLYFPRNRPLQYNSLQRQYCIHTNCFDFWVVFGFFFPVVIPQSSARRAYTYRTQPQLFSYSNIGTVNTVSGVISPTNLSLLSNPGGGSPTSSSGGGRSRCHSQTTLPRWNAQCSAGPPFITLDEDYMMTPLMSGNGGQGSASALIDDGECRRREGEEGSASATRTAKSNARRTASCREIALRRGRAIGFFT